MKKSNPREAEAAPPRHRSRVTNPGAARADAPSPRSTLMRLLVGNQVQQAIHVAARLRIADALAGGPKTIDELAAATGAHAAALRRLLRVLASFGVFVEDDAGRIALTPAATLLRRDEPGSLHAFALWSGGDRYAAFGELEYSVRTGQPAFEHVTGADFWEYLAGNPEAAAIFDAMMAANTAPLAPALAAYDFGAAETIVDVGGGRGELLASILRAHPGLRGVLAEHGRVMAEARRLFDAAGISDRCGIVSADIMTEVPWYGDVYLLKSVLHGLDDEAAVRLLGNCRRAIREGGKLLVIELVLPPGNEPFPGKLMDLLMLIGCRGRERSAEEFRDLLCRARFRVAQITATKFAYSIIESVPA
jgi:SAM-dependent methyltransferase